MFRLKTASIFLSCVSVFEFASCKKKHTWSFGGVDNKLNNTYFKFRNNCLQNNSKNDVDEMNCTFQHVILIYLYFYTHILFDYTKKKKHLFSQHLTSLLTDPVYPAWETNGRSIVLHWSKQRRLGCKHCDSGEVLSHTHASHQSYVRASLNARSDEICITARYAVSFPASSDVQK